MDQEIDISNSNLLQKHKYSPNGTITPKFVVKPQKNKSIHALSQFTPVINDFSRSVERNRIYKDLVKFKLIHDAFVSEIDRTCDVTEFDILKNLNRIKANAIRKKTREAHLKDIIYVAELYEIPYELMRFIKQRVDEELHNKILKSLQKKYTKEILEKKRELTPKELQGLYSEVQTYYKVNQELMEDIKESFEEANINHPNIRSSEYDEIQQSLLQDSCNRLAMLCEQAKQCIEYKLKNHDYDKKMNISINLDLSFNSQNQDDSLRINSMPETDSDMEIKRSRLSFYRLHSISLDPFSHSKSSRNESQFESYVKQEYVPPQELQQTEQSLNTQDNQIVRKPQELQQQQRKKIKLIVIE